MEIEIQGVHVTKHLQADAVHRPLADASENGVAEFAEKDIGEAGGTVGYHQPQQYCRRQGLQVLPFQGIDQVFQQEGDKQYCPFGQYQAQQRQQYPVA